MNKYDDYDPDLDYYFPQKRRTFIGRLLGAIVARLSPAGRGHKRARRTAGHNHTANPSQECA